MGTEPNFETLLGAMTQANPEHDRAFSLSVIAVMSDLEKHRLQKLQDSVLSADQVQMLERRIKEGFDAFGEAELLANHYKATGEAFTVIADASTRLANGRT
jgi:hypothetical protein